MHSDKRGLGCRQVAFEDGYMLEAIAFLAERYQTEVTVDRRHVNFNTFFDKALGSESIGDQITDRHKFHTPLVGASAQFRQTCHRSVVAHYLHQRGGRLQSGQAGQVNSGFSMATAAQHSEILGIERIDMPGAPERLRR